MNPALEKRKGKIIDIMKLHGVKRASLFGSFAQGRQNKSSDVDFLVEFEGGRSLLDLSGLKIDLQELLGRDVDIITYRSVHSLLKKSILAQQEEIM